jgi:DNA replication and repair protein RecF
MAAIFGQIDFTDNLKVNLFRKGAKKIYVNDSLLKKQTEIQNYIRSVCFCSNDIYIVKSEPGYRRSWIDKVVSQLEPVYVELIHRFNRLLKQRSHFWRSESFQKDVSSEVIESFDIQMSLISTRIFRRRRRSYKKENSGTTTKAEVNRGIDW